MPTFRCLHITHSTTMVDGHAAVATPEGALTSGLDVFLQRMAAVAHPAGMTVLLDGDAHTLLRLPERQPRKLDDNHPALARAIGAGWKASALQPWMTFRRHPARIHVGIMPWLGDANFPLLGRDARETMTRLFRFHVALGLPYYGSQSGLVGIDLMRDHHVGQVPLWMPDNWEKIPPAGTAAESATVRWRGKPHGKPYEHQLDARYQYLSAAGTSALALDKLTRSTTVTVQRRNLPGWYEITVPPWALSDVIPHPVDRAAPGERTWVAAPTLDLIWELADEGVMALPDVHQAWTSARKNTALRPWSERVRRAIDAVAEHQDQALTDAVKDVYKMAIGLLKPSGGRICRPDWQHTIIATARAVQWRRMWGEGNRRPAANNRGTGSGLWPAAIDHDSVWYPGETSDPADAWPRAWFPPGRGPGGYRHQLTRVTPDED